MILQILIAMLAGWINRHQRQVISYPQEENHVLKAQLGGRRLRLTDIQRRRLAPVAHPLGRQHLKETATIATADTLMRWYKRLIAQKFDGSQQRRQRGRPRVAEEIELLVVRMKEEALEQMVMLGERSLYYALHQYLAHYPTERNHQGLDNQLITREGEVGCHTGPRVAGGSTSIQRLPSPKFVRGRMSPER